MAEIIWRPLNSNVNEVIKKSKKEDNPAFQKKQDDNLIRQIIDNNEEFKFNVNSKREEVNGKMNERYLVGQQNQNPFMIGNNYLHDLDVQHKFLIPGANNNSK
jgi:hypothetical protein